MKNIIKFHIDHECYIKVVPLKKSVGCEAYFPKSIFLNHNINKKTYILRDDPHAIDLYVTNEDTINKLIPTTKYNIRLLVLQDILLTASFLGLDKQLILIDSDKTLFDLLQLPQSKKDMKLEYKLCEQFRDFLTEDYLELTDAVDGLQQVLSVFENGGLLYD